MPEVGVAVERRVQVDEEGLDPLALERAVAAEGRRGAKELHREVLRALDRRATEASGGARQRLEPGGPLDPAAFTHAFARLARRAGLPAGVRLHDLRHAYATELLRAGVHPEGVSEALGHASPAFTMSVYQHVLPSMGEQAAAAIEAALGDGD